MQGKECESLKCCHDCPADTSSNKKLFFQLNINVKKEKGELEACVLLHNVSNFMKRVSHQIILPTFFRDIRKRRNTFCLSKTGEN